MKPIFDASNLCTDICKTIFVILEVQFHHERGLSETRSFELFFLTWSRLSPYQKSASAEALFNEIFLVQNSGHNLHKKCKIFRFGNSLSEKRPFTFGRLKTLLDTLTYSAMVLMPCQWVINLYSLTLCCSHNSMTSAKRYFNRLQ